MLEIVMRCDTAERKTEVIEKISNALVGIPVNWETCVTLKTDTPKIVILDIGVANSRSASLYIDVKGESKDLIHGEVVASPMDESKDSVANKLFGVKSATQSMTSRVDVETSRVDVEAMNFILSRFVPTDAHIFDIDIDPPVSSESNYHVAVKYSENKDVDFSE
jgi:hypothetical protein